MQESIEDRLRRSLDVAEEKRMERERATNEEARRKLNAAEVEAAEQQDFANRYDAFDKIIFDLKKALDADSESQFRVTPGGKPNPSPFLRSNHINFYKKSTSASYGFDMHVDKKGVFKIVTPDADSFSSHILEVQKADFQELLFARFDAFIQSV